MASITLSRTKLICDRAMRRTFSPQEAGGGDQPFRPEAGRLAQRGAATEGEVVVLARPLLLVRGCQAPVRVHLPHRVPGQVVAGRELAESRVQEGPALAREDAFDERERVLARLDEPGEILE